MGQRKVAVARLPAPSVVSSATHEHSVQFYESDDFLCDAVARFIDAGMESGNPIIVIATPEHQRIIAEKSRTLGRDIESAVREGRLAQLEVQETLAKFMRGNLPDSDLFAETIGNTITAVTRGREDLPVLAFGEMVDALWREEQPEAAIRLEELWNGLMARYPFTLFCAYSMNGFYQESHRSSFDRICAAHSRIIPTERFTPDAAEGSWFRDVSLLQQRSLALQKEIEHRKEIEQSLLLALEERRQSEERLKQAELAGLLLAAVVESADDAIITKTLDGIITSWNAGAERIFGYKEEEIIGKPVQMLIPADHRDEEPQILAKLRAGQRIDHYETQRVRKDGRILDISLTVSPIKDSSGCIIGASKIARDITERKRIESERDHLLEREKIAREEAERAHLEALHASRLKDDFLAIISHELRTPLNAILGWATILSSRRDEPTLARAIEVIHRNAEAQKRLIEDLLEMARILTGKMVIRSERLDLVDVISSAIDTVRPATTGKGIKLNLAFDESARFIVGDADRLQQVFWNLLSNSIKFTPSQGTIEIVSKRSGNNVEISVRDTGNGISPDFLPLVFDRFRQGDASTTRRHGGLGLGLAIVRYLVEAHGGSVSASSPGEGLGATFVVSLPL